MKIAVLGSNGFMGKFLARSLSDKFTVLPVSRAEVDLSNFQDVKKWLIKNRPSVIINCASSTLYDKEDDVVFEDLQNNLNIFLNFYNNNMYFDRFISIGSGSEFDRKKSINNALEESIFNVTPTDSYGYSRNVISRLSYSNEKFYVLRLFGCFSNLEWDRRLFKRFAKGPLIEVIDRKVDYFSLQDFYTVIEHYLNSNDIIKDVNCVYKEKYLVTDLLDLFQKAHHINTEIKVITTSDKNYTGNGNKLESMNIPLLGLTDSIEQYFKD